MGTEGRSAGVRRQPPKRPPVRLTRRGRVVLLMAVLAVALGALWLGTRVAVTVASGGRLAVPVAWVDGPPMIRQTVP